MYDFINLFDLRQSNTVLNCSDRLLDLIVSNLTCVVRHHDLPMVTEHGYHPALDLSLDCVNKTLSKFNTNKVNKRYNFNRANYIELYSALADIDWSFLKNHDDVNVACIEFYNVLYNLIDRFVPTYHNKYCTYPNGSLQLLSSVGYV
ncbi:hypothetical protein RI129_011899 [Pyrocoelia pectoralis]|uniref:Uncharacterized protein n=1 Tax=Pyrocoelia pectoralis TaxID=417401 RepID=A0AAN7ZDE4_9COLE